MREPHGRALAHRPALLLGAAFELRLYVCGHGLCCAVARFRSHSGTGRRDLPCPDLPFHSLRRRGVPARRYRRKGSLAVHVAGPRRGTWRDHEADVGGGVLELLVIHDRSSSHSRIVARAWAAGAGPGDSPLTIDLDSTICETYGLDKEGARHHNYTGARGYHPLLAIAAGTGDVLMSRLREGRANTARGAAHFLRETVGRVRYGGASGQLTVRADSGFYAHALVAVCREMGVCFSITIRQHKGLRELIEAIPEQDWTPASGQITRSRPFSRERSAFSTPDVPLHQVEAMYPVSRTARAVFGASTTTTTSDPGAADRPNHRASPFGRPCA